MAKLPVGAVASQSLDFAWSNFGTLLKIGWFPLLASAVFSMAAEMPLSAGSGVDGSTEPTTAVVLIIEFGATALWAIFAVAVHRVILLDEATPDDWFYFRLGGEEIRYAIAPFVLGVIPWLIMVEATAVLFGTDIFSAFMPVEDNTVPNSGGMSAIQFLSLLGAVLLACLIMVRLELVMPIIVAEGKIGIWRAWHISSGNFWRLVGVNSLVMIGIVFLMMAFAAVVGLWLSFSSAVELPLLLPGGDTLGSFLVMIGGILYHWAVTFLARWRFWPFCPSVIKR